MSNILYDFKLTIFFMTIYWMYFSFLTCEVKCNAATLNIVNWQNAYSITIVIRGVVELYRAVKCEKKLHWEILIFFILHNHKTVRIYSHYALINESTTTFYCHSIHTFDFTVLNDKDKWTAYKFIKNVYNIWMSIHLKCICSVINQLSFNLNFKVSQEFKLQFIKASELSQELDDLLLKQSNVESASQTSQDDSKLISIVLQTITSDISISQEKKPVSLKRSKRKHTAK